MSPKDTPRASVETDLDLEVGAWQDGVPQPPRVILEKLEREHKVSRWMTPGHVAHRGMRGYETYSATPEDREAARKDGRFRVDVENKFCWGEDTFLAVMSRQQFENRAAARRRRSAEQTALSKSSAAFAEAARRVGSDAGFRVGEQMSRSLTEG